MFSLLFPSKKCQENSSVIYACGCHTSTRVTAWASLKVAPSLNVARVHWRSPWPFSKARLECCASSGLPHNLLCQGLYATRWCVQRTLPSLSPSAVLTNLGGKWHCMGYFWLTVCKKVMEKKGIGTWFTTCLCITAPAMPFRFFALGSLSVLLVAVADFLLFLVTSSACSSNSSSDSVSSTGWTCQDSPSVAAKYQEITLLLIVVH